MINTNDLIRRGDAIDTLNEDAELLRRVLDNTDLVGAERAKYEWGLGLVESHIADMEDLPPAEPEPIKVSVDHIMTEEELKELKQKIANSPVVLLPSAQPERDEELLTAISREAYDQGYNDGTVDAKTRFPINSERKKGKWIPVKGSNGKDYHKCSECLHTQGITGIKNYCAVCGADMRGDTE